jgi:hypothetical protein
MLKRLASRVLPALALVSLAVAAPGCKKGSDPGGEAPGGAAGAGGAAAPASDEISVRYKPGAAKLKESGKLTLKISGGQSGGANVDIVGTLDVSDAGGDKLKVAYKIDEVNDVSFTGVLQSKPKEGEAPKDPKAELLKASGARLVDLRGEADEDASKALPENKKPEGEGGGMAGELGEFLGLPELPETNLKIGAPVTKERETEEDLGGMKIPIDEESTYTLVKIDDSSGKRLAEIKIEKEGSGAMELPQGGGLLSIDQVSEMTLIFDLDDQLPVSLHIEQTTAFSAGPQGGETQINIDATYEQL